MARTEICENVFNFRFGKASHKNAVKQIINDFAGKMKRSDSVTRKNSLLYDLQHSSVLKGISNKNTVRQYQKQLVPFASWCKERGIKHMDILQKQDLLELMQEYADYLSKVESSASTIHARLAASCRVLKIPMGEIKKPRRINGENRRSRRFEKDIDINYQGRLELGNEIYKRLIEFQQRVGIRRAELASLRKNDLVQDESGAYCVRVRKGKGGKLQLQRILPEDIPFVTRYFDGTEDKMFSPEEMKNHIDLHGIRAEHAQTCYKFYVHMCQSSLYRQKITEQMLRRFEAFELNEKKRIRFQKMLTQTTRCCRGENAMAAKKLYGTAELDMTAIMAVSVFHLSHWRADVTVSNYLLSKRY